MKINKYEICTVLKTFPKMKKSDCQPKKDFKNKSEELDDYFDFINQNMFLIFYA